MSILENIHGHCNLAELNAEQRQTLCREIREFLISRVSQTGGHVASNLGVVELTVAIETVFDTCTDRLVFDVGHQSYIHKLLTGRQAQFETLRQFGGIAGFPKPAESEADAFVAGHASSSVSIALGMAKARTLKGEAYNVIALMGDGAATGGLAYEGLSNAAVSGEPMIVILNDNAMSIDRNVGGMASHLRNLRTKERYLGMKERYRKILHKIPGGKWIHRTTHRMKDRLRRMLIPTTIFENMGFTYLGPVDGHDVENLIFLLKTAKEMKRPVVLHVMTQKGKGYGPAEQHPKLFHGIGKFNPETGEPASGKSPTFSDSFGQEMLALAEEDDRICAITAAMPGGTGLLPFAEKFPDRMFDVGIAEEHAVSMAGGLAKQGMVPVVALYSTFLQRAYDQILQDVCMLNLHVVFAIDRAGLVGEDGETHHGIYDVGFLRHAPGLRILCPASRQELRQMLRWAVMEQNGPVAIRYPRGGDGNVAEETWKSDDPVVCHCTGEDITLITYSNITDNVQQASKILQSKGIRAGVLRMTEIQPLPINDILAKVGNSRNFVVVEEVGGNCGVRDAIAYHLGNSIAGAKVRGIDLGEKYICHGSVSAVREYCGLDPQAIADYVQEVLSNEN